MSLSTVLPLVHTPLFAAGLPFRPLHFILRLQNARGCLLFIACLSKVLIFPIIIMLSHAMLCHAWPSLTRYTMHCYASIYVCFFTMHEIFKITCWEEQWSHSVQSWAHCLWTDSCFMHDTLLPTINLVLVQHCLTYNLTLQQSNCMCEAWSHHICQLAMFSQSLLSAHVNY